MMSLAELARGWGGPGTVLAAVLLAGLVETAGVAGAAQAQQRVGPSGRPLPRFASLKAEPVNLRTGPGTQYPTAWVLRRAGMPLEIIEEFEAWRKVRDADGTTGWVLGSLLSGRRTAVVMPWALKDGTETPLAPLLASASPAARPLANLEAGTVADVDRCDAGWCAVRVGPFSGYLEQTSLWGVYDGERVE